MVQAYTLIQMKHIWMVIMAFLNTNNNISPFLQQSPTQQEHINNINIDNIEQTQDRS